MKKPLCIITALLLLITVLPSNIFASEISTDFDSIVYFDDGSYATIRTEYNDTRAAQTRTATKTYTHYQSNGNVNWKAVLTGTFAYNGTVCYCTAASCKVSITNTAWHEASNTATKSGNTASAAVTMQYKLLGITTNTKNIEINLRCDANRNVS